MEASKSHAVARAVFVCSKLCRQERGAKCGWCGGSGLTWSDTVIGFCVDNLGLCGVRMVEF
jgi:hypothetical protein